MKSRVYSDLYIFILSIIIAYATHTLLGVPTQTISTTIGTFASVTETMINGCLGIVQLVIPFEWAPQTTWGQITSSTMKTFFETAGETDTKRGISLIMFVITWSILMFCNWIGRLTRSVLMKRRITLVGPLFRLEINRFW